MVKSFVPLSWVQLKKKLPLPSVAVHVSLTGVPSVPVVTSGDTSTIVGATGIHVSKYNIIQV